jgi:hypothetical protein
MQECPCEHSTFQGVPDLVDYEGVSIAPTVHVIAFVGRKPVVKKWPVGKAPTQPWVGGDTPNMIKQVLAERLPESGLQVEPSGLNHRSARHKDSSWQVGAFHLSAVSGRSFEPLQSQQEPYAQHHVAVMESIRVPAGPGEEGRDISRLRLTTASYTRLPGPYKLARRDRTPHVRPLARPGRFAAPSVSTTDELHPGPIGRSHGTHKLASCPP